jgi:hypothetical protein
METESMAKKLKEEQAKAIGEAEKSAEETGTGNPALAPETSNVPEPGTTPDLDVLNTDDAKSLNPNITVSGTKPDGQGGYELLDTVDPAVANAALIPDTAPPPPKSPAKAPEQTGPAPAEGEVVFLCTADNRPFFTGGEMRRGERYTMKREEAELLVSLNAGQIEGGSDSNAKPEGSEAE